jgi:hypothetical protein
MRLDACIADVVAGIDTIGKDDLVGGDSPPAQADAERNSATGRQ